MAVPFCDIFISFSPLWYSQCDTGHIRFSAFQKSIGQLIRFAVNKSNPLNTLIFQEGFIKWGVFEEGVGKCSVLECHLGKVTVFKRAVVKCAVENDIGKLRGV